MSNIDYKGILALIENNRRNGGTYTSAMAIKMMGRGLLVVSDTNAVGTANSEWFYPETHHATGADGHHDLASLKGVGPIHFSTELVMRLCEELVARDEEIRKLKGE